MEIWLVCVIITGCMILFIKEWLPIEMVAMIGLSLLVVTKILTPQEALNGFGDPAIIILAGMFIMSAGLIETGVTDYIVDKIQIVGGSSFGIILFLVMIVEAVLSAFMNHTAATMVLIPVIMKLSGQSKIHPGKLLMPMAFASFLGGSCTAIGTTANIVMNSFLARNNLHPFTLFEFTPIGALLSVFGIAYLLLIGHRFIPARGEVNIEKNYNLREYLTEVLILEKSPLVGKTLRESQVQEKLNLTVLRISRPEKNRVIPKPNEILHAGDLLFVKCRVEDILKIKETQGIEIKPDFKLAEQGLENENIKLEEIVITPLSGLAGKTLKETRFLQQYNLVVLALYKHSRLIRLKLSKVKLAIGDVLLVQGDKESIEALRTGHDFMLLEELPISRFKRRKAIVAIGIFLAMLVLAGLQTVPIVVSVILGALLMVLTGCIKLDNAYRSVNWSTIILIAGMTSLGTATEKTGLAKILASIMVHLIGGWGPICLLGGFFILTAVLAQPMSNAGAALLIAPIALSTAVGLQLNPRTFIMTVTMAAHCTFLTPLEPVCALVYSPGKYHFSDFLRNGCILALLCMLVVLYFVPMFWPLTAQ